MSVSFDRVDSKMWWAETRFIEIEPELNEIAYTDANAETRAYMETVLGKIMAEIKTQFPYIEQNLTPKYNKSFNGLQEQLPFLALLVHAGMNNSLGMYVFFTMIGILVLAIIYLYVRPRKISTP